MTRDEVMRWVGEYERAWRAGDLDGVRTLFTEDAHYRTSPYERSEVGHDVRYQATGPFCASNWPDGALAGSCATVTTTVAACSAVRGARSRLAGVRSV